MLWAVKWIFLGCVVWLNLINIILEDRNFFWKMIWSSKIKLNRTSLVWRMLSESDGIIINNRICWYWKRAIKIRLFLLTYLTGYTISWSYLHIWIVCLRRQYSNISIFKILTPKKSLQRQTECRESIKVNSSSKVR